MKCTFNEKCKWWVHARCVGLHFPNDDAGNRALLRWLSKEHNFFCPKHMPVNPYKSDSESSSDDDGDEDDTTPKRLLKPLKPSARSLKNKRSQRQ